MSDKQSAEAVIAAGTITDIILERKLINALPENRQIPIDSIKKIIHCNLSHIGEYVNFDLFTVSKTTIEITDNSQLLTERSIEYCKKLIKKYICPSNYEQNDYIFNFAKLYDDSYYTKEEKNFFDLMFSNFIKIINNDLTSEILLNKNLLRFNAINDNCFYLIAKKVYNAILQNKIHAGDNIFPYIKEFYKSDNSIILQKLKTAKYYDYFFDENAVLKCDLDKNSNILIKNFINTVIYEFKDFSTKFILLNKLQSIYPLLIKDKIFKDFD